MVGEGPQPSVAETGAIATADRPNNAPAAGPTVQIENPSSSPTNPYLDGEEAEVKGAPKPNVASEEEDQEPAIESGPSRRIQTKELHELADTNINIAGKQIKDKINKAPTKKEGVASLSTAEKELYSLFTIRGWKESDGDLEFVREDSKGHKSGTPLNIEGVGLITKFRVLEGGKLKVHISGSDSEVEVDRARVEEAQLLSHKNDILNNFSGSRREIEEIEINSIEHPGADIFGGKTNADINSLIESAADEASYPTTGDIRTYVSGMPDSPQKQELLTMLSGSNLPSSEIIDKVYVGANTDKALVDLRADVKRLQETVNNNKGNKEAIRSLDVAQRYLKLYTDAEAKLQSGGSQEIINKISAGQIDIEKSKAIKNALRTGRMDALIPLLAKDLQDDPDNDSPEVLADKAEKRRELKKKMETMSWFALAALLLSGMAVGKLGEGVVGGGR